MEVDKPFLKLINFPKILRTLKLRMKISQREETNIIKPDSV